MILLFGIGKAMKALDNAIREINQQGGSKMKIVTDFIDPGRQSRPATNPASSLYGKTRAPEYITIHNAWSQNVDARGLNAYMNTDSCAARPASWHFSVDEKEAVNGVPIEEVAWHAGDGLHGTGNRLSIGIEICDYAILYRDSNRNLRAYGPGHPTYPKYLEAEENAAKLTAHLIKTVKSLRPFPECVVQHTKWRAASGCPSHIRGRTNGWNDFLKKVRKYLDAADEKPPATGLIYRVLGGSFKSKNNAESRAVQIEAIGADWNPFIVYNRVGGKKYFRVVAAEKATAASAETATKHLQRMGIAGAFVVAVRADATGDLPLPVKDLPIEDPSVPEDAQPEIPSGLMALLKQLYELLKNLFG